VAKVGTSKNSRIVQGLHNKPTGCGASGAYAPGPDKEEDVSQMCGHVSFFSIW